MFGLAAGSDDDGAVELPDVDVFPEACVLPAALPVFDGLVLPETCPEAEPDADGAPVAPVAGTADGGAALDGVDACPDAAAPVFEAAPAAPPLALTAGGALEAFGSGVLDDFGSVVLAARGSAEDAGWSSPGAAQSDAQDVPPTSTAAAKNECRVFMTADLLNGSK